MVKILNWNINGLRAILKKDYIQNNKKEKDNTFINFIKKYDIICLQEIKLCDKTIDNLLEILPEYNIYYSIPSCQKRGYSGVAILSKLTPISYSNILNEDNEGRYIHIEFNKFYLINVYFPNAGDGLKRLKYKDNFNKIFLKNILKLKSKKEVIITGDFNAIQSPNDTYDFKLHHNKLSGVTDLEIKFLNELTYNGFKNTFRELYLNKTQYSYFSYKFPARKYNKGLLIDFILITENLLKKVKSIKYLDNIYGSDHIPVELTLDIN